MTAFMGPQAAGSAGGSVARRAPTALVLLGAVLLFAGAIALGQVSSCARAVSPASCSCTADPPAAAALAELGRRVGRASGAAHAAAGEQPPPSYDAGRYAHGPAAAAKGPRGPNYLNITSSANVTSWEAAVAALPECARGAPVEELSRGGAWYSTAAGELVYEPRSCRLRRLTPDDARACLANTTVAFVGDSLLRYQYISLAHLLALRRYPERYGDGDDPNPVMEKQWPNFTVFYELGSKQLRAADGTGSSSEVCDCYRINLDDMTKERRRVEVNVTAIGGRQAPAPATVAASYYQAFGLNANVALETVNAMRFSRDAALRSRATRVVFVINIGHWQGRSNRWSPLRFFEHESNFTVMAAHYESVFLTDAAREGAARTIWKTTTPHLQPNNKTDGAWPELMTAMAKFHGWDVYDARAIADAAARAGLGVLIDVVHFWPYLYDQLNDVLLNTLC